MPSWMSVGRSGATCSAALQGRQTECGGDGLTSRSPGGQTQCAGVSRPQGGNDGSPRGARRTAARCHARQRGPAMPGDAKTIQAGASNYPMRSIWHLSAGSLCRRWRTPTAIERSRSDRRRRAPRRNGWARGGLTWPRSAVLCAFGVEGALRPLADSAGQALSRFMPSASIHKARLIFTFWSMP